MSARLPLAYTAGMSQENGSAAETRPLYCEVALGVPVPRTFSYRVGVQWAETLQVGAVVRVPFGRRERIGVVTGIGDRVPEVKGLKEIAELLPAPYRLDPTALELARWVAAYYACSLGEAVALLLPPRPGTRARRRPWDGDEEPPSDPQILLPDQEKALARIDAVLSEQRHVGFLLHGVTGSGKTEVYLQAIAHVLEQGRSALVLLPEISLTPQTLQRLQRRFPGRVAPYHSRLSQGERCAVWEAAAEGRLPIVVGPRSAVFLPMKQLGLIVVDEEHDPSYKSDARPRYHARDVALMRGRREGIPVILGSATPSLESYHNAREGKFELLTLPTRIGADELPRVEIVDLRERVGSGLQILSPPLEEAIEEALGRDEQVIVFHNRRGYARFLQCHACGHVETCPHCDISLIWHLAGDQLRCHYCGFHMPRPRICSECGEKVLRPRGIGTQRVELALTSRFPQARILRLDHDTTTTKRSHHRLLERFGRGEADILLGTQMVAKGLHFPRVTVVGVISADAGLHFPDLRAHERAFQLLIQVAGRSGRVSPGRVILQSHDPEHRVLRRVVHHDVLGFLDEELEQRRQLRYPPFRRLSAVLAAASSEALLDEVLGDLAAGLRRLLRGSGVEILGPARAALPRLQRRWRGQILLKGSLSAGGKAAVTGLLEETAHRHGSSRKVEITLDVDPQQLL